MLTMEEVLSDPQLPDATKRVLFFASQEAALSRSSTVTTAHLALGLLRESNSMFTAQPVEVRSAIEKIVPAGTPQSVEPSKVSFEGITPVLAEARLEADRAGSPVTCELLLNTLMRSSEGKLAKVLHRFVKTPEGQRPKTRDNE
jgi:ATP-dependent Clp protease ATP-binding subunit ClpA